jgi:hypothetical protein
MTFETVNTIGITGGIAAAITGMALGALVGAGPAKADAPMAATANCMMEGAEAIRHDYVAGRIDRAEYANRIGGIAQRCIDVGSTVPRP